MGNRYALLIGSEHPIAGADPISRETVRSNLEAMSEVLTSLGSLSFGWPRTAEPKRSGSNRTKVYEYLDVFTAGSVTEDDVFLLYYFGHGFLKGENLCLSFTQLILSGDTTSCHLSTILGEVHNKGFRKILCIIDCCHAGAAAQGLETALKDSQYCAMFASTNSYSQFSARGGVFTRELSSALSYAVIQSSIGAPLRDPKNRAITFKSWFEYVQGKMRDRSYPQEPMLVGSLDIALVAGDVRVSSNLNVQAPLKSLYRKLYAILSLIGNRTWSETALYDQVTTLKPTELMVSAIERGRTTQNPVSQGKFHEYIDIAADLGLLTLAHTSSRRWKLSNEGLSAWENDGARYNEVLVSQVTERLETIGLTIETLREHLFHLAQKGRLPNLENLLRRLLEQKETTPEKKSLRLILRLLGYTGLVQKATSDTYFP